MNEYWHFPASPFDREYELGVVDGDTIWFQLDLGFWMWYVQPLRLANVDTHEIHFVSHDSEEYQRGIKERDFVRNWMKKAVEEYDGHWPLTVITEKRDDRGKYGRILAHVRRNSDDEYLNDRILEEFDGVEY